MKNILLISFLLFSTFTFSQSFQVSGKVTDFDTRQPLVGASVFCQNTTLGTVTNANGEFSIWLNNGGYDIVVSFTGYETQSTRINNSSSNLKALNFDLKPKQKSMEEVAITVSNEVKDGWVKYGDFFKESFIGLSANSSSCTIDNTEALRFFYSKKRNRLKVSAKEDLVITNNALGYKIRYQLDSFVHEYESGITQYTGFPFFEELQGTPEQAATWAKNREKAYYGSMLHFMRCYYDSSLGINGYKVELINPKTDQARQLNNPYDSVYYNIVNDRDVELTFAGKLRVVYSQEQPESKYLEKNKLALNTTVQISVLDISDALVIEQNGYFYDQRDILNYGYWNWEKIADFLPYNYEPQHELEASGKKSLTP